MLPIVGLAPVEDPVGVGSDCCVLKARSLTLNAESDQVPGLNGDRRGQGERVHYARSDRNQGARTDKRVGQRSSRLSPYLKANRTRVPDSLRAPR